MKNAVCAFLIIGFVGMVAYFLYCQITEHFAQMDPMLRKIQQHLIPLHPMVRSISFYEGNKSYTINKHKIYLCLRDEHSQYYEFNMLVYVAIHEIAHVLCDDVGHTPKFHKIFDDLLRQAASMGLYDPTIPITPNYCGHN